MKRVIEIVLIVTLAAGGIALAAGMWGLHDARGEVETFQNKIAAQWLRFEARVRADEERWRDHELIKPRQGGDAGPVIFAHAALTGPKLEIFTPPSTWVSQIDATDLGSFNTQWLHALSDFGFWEPYAPGAPLENEPVALAEANYKAGNLTQLARAHLAQGLKAGDARPAAADVRELARLCLSSENLFIASAGVAVLKVEYDAFDEATKRGHDTSGWQPMPQEARDSLLRVLFASVAPFALLTPRPLSDTELPVFRCVGLGDSLWLAHITRHSVEHELANRYAALNGALAKGACRLPRLRAQLAHPSPPVFNRLGARDYLPFSMTAAGLRMLAQSSNTWLEKYELANP